MAPPPLATATGINNHIRDVSLDNVAIAIKVEDREWPASRGHTAGVPRRLDVVCFDEVEYSCVERRGHPRATCHMEGALAHTVVYLVALRLNDPVIPTDVAEIHVVVLAAAEVGVLAAAEAALGHAVSWLPHLRLGHQEGLVGLAGVDYCRDITPVPAAFQFELQGPVLSPKETLQRRHEGEGTPAAALSAQSPLAQQRAIAPHQSAFPTGKEDSQGEAGYQVSGNSEVEPKLSPQDVNVLVLSTAELELQPQGRGRREL